MEQLSACLACGGSSEQARVVHVRKDDRLVRCPRCRLVYANPQYTVHELTDLYRTWYYEETLSLETDQLERDYLTTRSLHRTVVRDLLRRYPRLAPTTGARTRVLDYGCGVGHFLAVCKEQGMRPFGLDFSSVAARVAKQQFDVEVGTDPDESLRKFPDGEYQLVTAWQVIEHLRRPREALTQLARVLAPGGVLCLAVPHLGALQYRIKRERWFNIRNPTHLAFFNQQNLTQLLEQVGLVKVVRPVFFGGRPKPNAAVDLAQFLIRWAGLGSDLRLYAEKPLD